MNILIHLICKYTLLQIYVLFCIHDHIIYYFIIFTSLKKMETTKKPIYNKKAYNFYKIFKWYFNVSFKIEINGLKLNNKLYDSK